MHLQEKEPHLPRICFLGTWDCTRPRQGNSNSRTPKDVSEVRSLLGMTNFCCRFIKNYATLTEPLRELTKKGIPFVWTKSQERALERLRVALTSAPENAYFDSTKITEVYTDASPVGVAAVLTQKEPDGDKRKVIAFASRAMSSPE